MKATFLALALALAATTTASAGGCNEMGWGGVKICITVIHR